MFPHAVLSLAQWCLHSLALVWNVSQSLPPPPMLRLADHSWYPLDSVLQTDAIKQSKCFVCLPLAKPRAQSRLYLSECTGGIEASRGWSTDMCISLPLLKGSLHQTFKVIYCSTFHQWWMHKASVIIFHLNTRETVICSICAVFHPNIQNKNN